MLAEFRRRTLSPAEHERTLGLIEKLSDEHFEVRQRASDDLVASGTRVSPVLRAAIRHTDAERAHRAAQCLKRITEEGRPLPTSAAHLLALRKPDVALEVLLDYLPFAEEESLAEEVRNTLSLLAMRGGEPDPVLLRALADKYPLRRAASAEALLKARPGPPPPAVRKLLGDADPLVRLRTALILATRRDGEAIPVLIEALAEEPSESQAQARDLLERLAGEKGPQVEPGLDEAGRKKERNAWANWWKGAAARTDLAVLEGSAPLLGYTMLADFGNNRVLELGRDGKPRWIIENLQGPIDAYVLGSNRVLIAEYKGCRVTERDFKGNILWKKDGLGSNVVNAQRLSNGHTFIALDNQLLEVDAAGATVWTLPSNGLQAAHKGSDGVITCLTKDNRCVRLLPNGQEVRAFPLGRQGSSVSGLDVLPNGRILVSRQADDTVVELDSDGNVQWQAKAAGCLSATRLPNGHTLIAGNSDATEIDQANNVVWEYKGSHFFRARRR